MGIDLKVCYLKDSQIEHGRQKESERESIGWLTPRLALQCLTLLLDLPHEYGAPNTWAVLCCFSRPIEQGAGSQAEQLRHEPAPIRDAVVGRCVGGSGFTLLCHNNGPSDNVIVGFSTEMKSQREYLIFLGFHSWWYIQDLNSS